MARNPVDHHPLGSGIARGGAVLVGRDFLTTSFYAAGPVFWWVVPIRPILHNLLNLGSPLSLFFLFPFSLLPTSSKVTSPFRLST